MKEESMAIRERVASCGIGALGDAELLALIIGEGRSPLTPLDQARGVLEHYGGNLGRVCGEELPRLRMVAGLGLKRAQRIAAAAELGRRMQAAESGSVTVISSSEDVKRLLLPMLSGLRHEECWAVYLTSSNRVIERAKVSQGGVQNTVVDHRLIVKRALELLATQMILVHNHPSGAAMPSEADVILTRRIEEAAALFDIQLLDHIIFAREDDFSFRRAALLK